MMPTRTATGTSPRAIHPPGDAADAPNASLGEDGECGEHDRGQPRLPAGGAPSVRRQEPATRGPVVPAQQR